MKRILSAILALSMFLTASTAIAEDLGVQVIGSGDTVMETLSLDDMQLGSSYDISGYATVQPLSYAFVDDFPYYAEGKVGDNSVDDNRDRSSEVWYRGTHNNNYYNYFYNNIFWARSGENADYAWLLVDLTNLQKKPISFMEEASVVVVFDDEYEFQGWCRQFNYDYDSTRKGEGSDGYGTLIRAAISGTDEEPIDMVYTGHYAFGCTLPNTVVESKKPLRMEIKLGDNELTYHIRK